MIRPSNDGGYASRVLGKYFDQLNTKAEVKCDVIEVSILLCGFQ